MRRSSGRIRGNDEAIHQVEQGVRHLPDLWMSRHHDIERQSDARAYLLGVAVPHEIHPSRTVQRKDLADMTKARITKRTNTVLARNRDLAQQLAALQLHWSTAKPTVPGQYWWRAGADIVNPECMYVEHIRLWKGQLVNAYTLEPPEDGEWAGPLVPPEEAR